jgi:hypothetical protein
MKPPSITPSTEQPHADEQALLRHYRQHSLAQPTPAMDALILAAAAAQLKPAKPPLLPIPQALQHWFFAAGQRLRWSLAFASLASIGLGLNFSLRSLDQLPPAYDLGEPRPVMSAAPQPASAPPPVPMASAIEPMASAIEPKAETMQLQKQQLPSMAAGSQAPARTAPASGKISAQSQTVAAQPLGELPSRRVAVQQDAVAPASSADSPQQADSNASPAKAKATLSLEQALRVVLQLQRSGASEQAAVELQRLQRQYPGRDLAAELATLPASKR